jgi:hypothetical protein
MSKRQVSGDKPQPKDGIRNALALSVSLLSIGVVAVLAGLAIGLAAPGTRERAVQLVLTAVLPLVGSWVGTILAFFFSGENLRTATESVATLQRELTSQERLRSIPVQDKMIKRAGMKAVETRPFDQIRIGEAIQNLEAAKVNRLVVLDADDRPRLVVHRSLLDRYLASKNLAAPSANHADLTVQDMLNDAAFKDLLASTFETVQEAATLAEAKAKMEQTPNCQDVFVTRNGSRSEAVLGWITNVILEDSSRV